MNVKFFNSVNNCNSAIEASIALESVQKEITSLLNGRVKDYLKGSPLSLAITIIANPDEVELSNAHKHNDKIWSILSEELSSDPNLYAFRNRLGSINVPVLFKNVLIALGIEQYVSSVKSSISPKAYDDDEERPVFKLKKPKWKLEDVLLDDEIKFRILRALSIIENRNLIFDEWGFGKIDKSTKSILCFYGAPGTGKTMTAEAIASYLKKPIVHSSYAEIESKWVGEGAKNLHAIFEFAEKNDAVLFFDEADSFLSSRIKSTEGSSDKHYNRMSNELFQLLEDFNGCVVFSTNLLTDVDDAFKSRIIDSIKFELPDSETRVKLIKLLIPANFPLENDISDEQFMSISEIADGFSGRDIRKSILLSLAGASIKKVQEGVQSFGYDDIAAGFVEVSDYKKKMLGEEGFIPVEDVEEVIAKQKKNENLVDLAIYGMYSDGVLHETEIELIKEYSKALLGSSIEEPIELPSKSIQNICMDAINNNYANEALDVALRVIAADGNFEDGERKFITEIVDLLKFDAAVDDIIEYGKHLTKVNNHWISLSQNLSE
ncbi:MAG: AAA family ATPase [Bacteroidales bacterium]|nr:AAA family ATPase [Bacteroidales bacterium]